MVPFRFIFTIFLQNVTCFILFIGLFGYLISICSKTFYKVVGNTQLACYMTGVIGTPIHECAHALMCIVFRHKIHRICLFRIGDDGVLGFVEHSHNPKSIYQTIGNFFIGIAPITVGGMVLLLLMRLMVPELYFDFSGYISDFIELSGDDFGIEWIYYALLLLRGLAISMVDYLITGDGWMIIYLVLALCIALHMNLSGADIKNALPAIPWLLLIFAVVNVVLGIFPVIYNAYVNISNVLGAYALCVLLISLGFAVITALSAYLVKNLVSVAKKTILSKIKR